MAQLFQNSVNAARCGELLSENHLGSAKARELRVCRRSILAEALFCKPVLHVISKLLEHHCAELVGTDVSFRVAQAAIVGYRVEIGFRHVDPWFDFLHDRKEPS